MSDENREQVVDNFDPKAIDVNDTDAMAGLTEEQLAKVHEYHASQPPAPEPEAAPAETQDTPPAEKPAEPAPAPAPAEVRFAGKYATSDELLKGVEEAAKKLGYLTPALQETLTAAKETGEFKTVERLYKSLESEIGRKATQPAAEPIPAPSTSPATDTAALDTATEAEITRSMMGLTFKQIEQSELAAEMARRGLQLPRTQADLDVLIDTAPYYATRFQNEFRAGFDKNMSEAREFVKAQKGVTQHDAQVFDADVQSLRGELKGYGLDVTDAEIADLKARLEKSAFAREDRHGVPHLRRGIARAIYMAEIMPTKIISLRDAAILQGREQAVKDLQTEKEKNTSTLSTSGLRSTERTRTGEKGKIDINDPAVIAKLTDRQLEYYAQHGRLPD